VSRFQYIPKGPIHTFPDGRWQQAAERLVDTQTGQVWFRDGDKWESLAEPVAEVVTHGERDRVRLRR
jgi:hypothetical protein